MYLEFSFTNVLSVIRSYCAFNNIEVLRYCNNKVHCRVSVPCVLSQLNFPVIWNVVITSSSSNFLYLDIYKLF